MVVKGRHFPFAEVTDAKAPLFAHELHISIHVCYEPILLYRIKACYSHEIFDL